MVRTHARLGIKVTLIDAMQILAKDDTELVDFGRRRLQAYGVEILKDTPAKEIKEVDRNIIVRLSDEQDLLGSHLLVAEGRASNV